MTPKKQIKRATPSLLVLATCVLVGCAGEPTTVTTTTTREVTTTGPATREVLVTQAPPAVRVETQPVSPGPGYIWTSGYWLFCPFERGALKRLHGENCAKLFGHFESRIENANHSIILSDCRTSRIGWRC